MTVRQIWGILFIFIFSVSFRHSITMDAKNLQDQKDSDCYSVDWFMPNSTSDLLKDFLIYYDQANDFASKKLLVQWHEHGDYFRFHGLFLGQEKSISFLNDEPEDPSLFDFVYSKATRFICPIKKDFIQDSHHLASILDAVMDRIRFDRSASEDPMVAYRRMLASSYTIHVVPRFEEFSAVVQKIFKELSINKEFRSLIKGFKLHKGAVAFFEENAYDIYCFDSLSNELIKLLDKEYIKSLRRIPVFDTEKSNDIVSPIIINPIRGKKNAERVIEILAKIFPDPKFVVANEEHQPCYEGLDIFPLFDQRITSLISYTQGTIEEKINPYTKNCFQGPGLICYDPVFAAAE